MADDVTIDVSVDVSARIATVFRFLSEPDRLAAWLGEGAEVEPREGGALRVPYPHGAVAVGRVESIEAGRRLVFTWGYETGEHGIAPGTTRVTVELEPIATGTRVHLRHEGLPDEAARSGHRQGWKHYMSVLAARAAAVQFDGIAEAAVDAWVAAWNERDAAERDTWLERSFEAAGQFRDALASVDGRAELADYIAGTQGVMPGARLHRAGAVDQVHDRVRFSWRFESEGGGVLGSGWNVGRLTLDGRFAEVVGFWDA